MLNPKVFIQKVKDFIAVNPRRSKFIGILILLAFLPIVVIAALTVQNLSQKAGGLNTVQITDINGNVLTQTLTPYVYIKINLPPNWTTEIGMNKNNIIPQAFAQTACRPPYKGYLGCFTSSDSPFGSACTSSCTTDSGQDGQYCYTSTTVGSSCTSSTGTNGVCSEQGECVANADSTPAYSTPTSISQCDYFSKPDRCNDNSKFCFDGTCHPCSSGFLNLDQTKGCEASPGSGYPTPVYSTPISPPTASCGNSTCSSNETCIGTSYDNSTLCLLEGVGKIGSYCGTPDKSPNSEACSSGYCDSTLRCTNKTYPTPQSPSSTPTTTVSTINRLRKITIENIDSYSYDIGGTGGNPPYTININPGDSIPTHLEWKLNELLSHQDSARRDVQVTFTSDTGFQAIFAASTILARKQPLTSGSSVFTSGSSVSTSKSSSNLDVTSDGVVNKDDMKVIEDQIGKTGNNLRADLNLDGQVDGVDINYFLREISR